MPKISKPLSDMQIKNAKPQDKPYRLADGGNMYLLISNDSKLWRMDYSIDGKRKTVSFGKYPDVSLEQARQYREEARKLIATGVDPVQLKKAQKAARYEMAANTFEVIAREWFAKKRSSWAESYSKKVISVLQNHIFPWVGAQPITAINAPKYLEVLRRIEERGIIETAHKARTLCDQVHRYAVATGRADNDPISALKGALAPINTKHLAAVTDPQKVVELLRVIDGYKGSFAVACALKIAPYVFVRPGELRAMQWADIDFEIAEWRYDVTKTKTQHIVPLAWQVLAILKELQPMTGHGRYAFPNATHKDRPMSDNTMRAALKRMGYDNDDEGMTVHGFRAMARTMLDEVLGYPPHLIEHQLAHAVRDPLGRAYNRTKHLPERKEMMQKWADYLDGLKQRAKVIPFPVAG